MENVNQEPQEFHYVIFSRVTDFRRLKVQLDILFVIIYWKWWMMHKWYVHEVQIQSNSITGTFVCIHTKLKLESFKKKSVFFLIIYFFVLLYNRSVSILSSIFHCICHLSALWKHHWVWNCFKDLRMRYAISCIYFFGNSDCLLFRNVGTLLFISQNAPADALETRQTRIYFPFGMGILKVREISCRPLWGVFLDDPSTHNSRDIFASSEN